MIWHCADAVVLAIHPAWRELPDEEDDADNPSSLTAGLSATLPVQYPADQKYEGGGDKEVDRSPEGLIVAASDVKAKPLRNYDQEQRRLQTHQDSPLWGSVSSGGSSEPRWSQFPPPPTDPPSIPLPLPPANSKCSEHEPRAHSAPFPPPLDYPQKDQRLSPSEHGSLPQAGVIGTHVFPPSPPESNASSIRSPAPFIDHVYPPSRHPPPPPSSANARNVYAPSRTPLAVASNSSYHNPSLVRRPTSPLSAIASVTSSTTGELPNRSSSQMQTLSSTWSMSSLSSQQPSTQKSHRSEGSDSSSIAAPSTSSSGRRTLASMGGGSRLRSMLQKSVPPLIQAVKAGDLPQVQNLLAPGLRTTPVGITDRDGLTALHHAAMIGHEAICEVLLNHSALTEARSKYQKRTPLYYASALNHPNVVAILLAAGAAPNARSTMDGASALHKSSQKGHVDCMEQLIAAGADVNMSDIEGMSPLMWATQGKAIEAARLLITSGANLEARINLGKNLEMSSKEGLTVLHKAVAASDYPFAELFVTLGADINNIGAHGIKPLHKACARGDAQMVELLLNFEADPNEALGEGGWTPLHWAARYGHRRVALLLVSHGAWAGARTKSAHGAASGEGLTPRELSMKHGFQDVV